MVRPVMQIKKIIWYRLSINVCAGLLIFFKNIIIYLINISCVFVELVIISFFPFRVFYLPYFGSGEDAPHGGREGDLKEGIKY